MQQLTFNKKDKFSKTNQPHDTIDTWRFYQIIFSFLAKNFSDFAGLALIK